MGGNGFVTAVAENNKNATKWTRAPRMHVLMLKDVGCHALAIVASMVVEL